MESFVATLVHGDVFLLIQSADICQLVTSRYVDSLLVALCCHFGEHFPSTQLHGVLFCVLELALNCQTTNQFVEMGFSELVVWVHTCLGCDASLTTFLCDNRKMELDWKKANKNIAEDYNNVLSVLSVEHDGSRTAHPSACNNPLLVSNEFRRSRRRG